MRILYIDIDSLRPDHLGCYGYHRNTSPHIDALAARGVRFDQVYASDAPCLPSRTALWSGRFGFHTGVIDHGGTASQPFVDAERPFQDSFATTSWMGRLHQRKYLTATISSFGYRHSAWHWFAGYREVYDPGKHGWERADEVTPIVLDWLGRNAQRDDWFLHVNFWDAHTPYRTPPEYPNIFADEPLPAHVTEAYWRERWDGYGPHSPQEVNDFGPDPQTTARWNVPDQLDSMDTVRWWFDHYDLGIRYIDDHIGQIVARLDALGVLHDTLIMVSADHGESQGELNVWGDHHTADEITCHIPLIVAAPGMVAAPRVDRALHYHFDWAATLLELVGDDVPATWDAQPFTAALRQGADAGRPFLVTSQGAWSCQRGVRFDQDDRAYLLLRTYHDGYKMLDDLMLFDLHDDPHEQRNIVGQRPEIVRQGLAYLDQWHTDMLLSSRTNVDPMMTVLRQGGGFHTRGKLPAYLDRLRATGRAHHAEYLARKHGVSA